MIPCNISIYTNTKAILVDHPGRRYPPSENIVQIKLQDTGHNSLKPLYDYLATVYDYSQKSTVVVRETVLCNVILTNKKGILLTANKNEEWSYWGCFPTSIQFGELDFSSSELVDIDIFFRFSGSEYHHSEDTQSQVSLPLSTT